MLSRLSLRLGEPVTGPDPAWGLQDLWVGQELLAELQQLSRGRVGRASWAGSRADFGEEGSEPALTVTVAAWDSAGKLAGPLNGSGLGLQGGISAGLRQTQACMQPILSHSPASPMPRKLGGQPPWMI